MDLRGETNSSLSKNVPMESVSEAKPSMERKLTVHKKNQASSLDRGNSKNCGDTLDYDEQAREED